MRSITLIVCVFLCFTCIAFAEESQALSQQAMQSVQQQTREMSAIGIPEAQARKMLTQMAQNRFQKQNRIRAQQVVAAAAKAGLPTEPVMSKAMEGMAKQANQQQVIAAMETVRSRYAHAHRLAKTLADDDESIDTITQSIADSLAADMQAGDMEAVMAQVRTRQQTQTHNKAENDQLAIQTAQTVRTMARLGLRSSDVSDTLCQALQNRYTYRDMNQLRHHISRQSHQMTPQQIASQHAGSIGKGGQGGNAGSGSGSGAGGGGSGSGAGGGGGSGSGAGGSGSGPGGGGSGGGSGGS